jgi:hypothetical protein
MPHVGSFCHPALRRSIASSHRRSLFPHQIIVDSSFDLRHPAIAADAPG